MAQNYIQKKLGQCVKVISTFSNQPKFLHFKLFFHIRLINHHQTSIEKKFQAAIYHLDNNFSVYTDDLHTPPYIVQYPCDGNAVQGQNCGMEMPRAFL